MSFVVLNQRNDRLRIHFECYYSLVCFNIIVHKIIQDIEIDIDIENFCSVKTKDFISAFSMQNVSLNL